MKTVANNASWRIRVMNEGNAFLFINTRDKKTFLYSKNDIQTSLDNSSQNIQGSVPLSMLLVAKTILQTTPTPLKTHQPEEMLLAA